MINSNSIARDTAEDTPVSTSLANMADYIARMGGRAKDKQTVLAVLALGSPDAMKAISLAHEVEPFLERHMTQTAYTLELQEGTLRIVAKTPQTNLQEDQLVFEKDMTAL